MRLPASIRCAAIGFILSASPWALAQDAAPKEKAPAQPATATSPPATTGPRLELSSTEFDFGEVWQGEPVSQDFTVRNAGTAPLELSLSRSCGCTALTKPRSPLPPGESDVFSIAYDTVKRKGKAKQRVTLTTNDAARPSVNISVTGNVKPLYNSSPPEGLRFYRLTTEESATKSIKFRNRYDGPLNFRLAAGQDFGPFEIVLKEIKPGQEYEMTATTQPPLKENLARIEVVLETGIERTPTVVIPVQAWVQPDVTCQTKLLRVARQSIVPMQQNIGLEFRADKPVQITEVRPSTDTIKYEILAPVPRRGQGDWLLQTVRVTLPAGDQLPPGDAELVIFTDSTDPRYQKFTIPVRVVEPQGEGQEARLGNTPAPHNLKAKKP